MSVYSGKKESLKLKSQEHWNGIQIRNQNSQFRIKKYVANIGQRLHEHEYFEVILLI